MKVCVYGEVSTSQLVKLRVLASEFGLKIHEQSDVKLPNLAMVKIAIKQATGFEFDEISKGGKDVDRYFARLIFCYQAERLCKIDIDEQAKLINRDAISVRSYAAKYATEYRINREFRKMAQAVETFLNECVSQ